MLVISPLVELVTKHVETCKEFPTRQETRKLYAEAVISGLRQLPLALLRS